MNCILYNNYTKLHHATFNQNIFIARSLSTETGKLISIPTIGSHEGGVKRLVGNRNTENKTNIIIITCMTLMSLLLLLLFILSA